MSVHHEVRPDLISELAGELVAAGPALDELDQRITVAIYRLLAGGDPVPPVAIAERVGLPVERVVSALDSWPGVYRDHHGAVTGFWGLALTDMPHRFTIQGRTLYTWCAWDALFLPVILDTEAHVQSACATTGEPVTLTVTPAGVDALSPATAVLSFLRPDDRLGADVISSFCHHIVFLSSPTAAQTWTATHPDTFLLSIQEGFDLGRRTWQARLGTALGNGAALRP